MKILYLTDRFHPGRTDADKLVWSLATMMQKAGHKVKILTHGVRQDDAGTETAHHVDYTEAVFQGIPILTLNDKTFCEHIPSGSGTMTSMASPETLLWDEKPDIAHVLDPARVSDLAASLIRLCIPYVVTLIGVFPVYYRNCLPESERGLSYGPDGKKARFDSSPEPQERVLAALQQARKLLRCAKVVVSPSNLLAQILTKKIPGARVRVIDSGMLTVAQEGYAYNRIYVQVTGNPGH